MHKIIYLFQFSFINPLPVNSIIIPIVIHLHHHHHRRIVIIIIIIKNCITINTIFFQFSSNHFHYYFLISNIETLEKKTIRFVL